MGRPALHGLNSPARVQRAGTAQKRRMLRRLGVSAQQLDAIGRGYLDLLARSLAKVELLDDYFQRNGFLDEEGRPRPGADRYFQAIEASRRNLAKLEEHVLARAEGPSMVVEMQALARGNGS